MFRILYCEAPEPMKRVILTGGPGVGKTTVLDVLREDGYTIGEDAARSIIVERKEAGLSPRPEAEDFAEQILEREIAAYRSATYSPMFYERGIVDVAGSLYAMGAMNEPATMQLIAKYPYEYVFLFPPWPDIYQMDEERDHTFEHSARVYGLTRDWYLQVGYDLGEVPIDTPQARAQFILDHSRGA